MSTLVFTVGLNGYAGAYKDCIDTHEAYARRLGARYIAVRRPLVVRERALTAWLKVTLLEGALAAGYRWVAFVDCDARIAPAAPDFRESLPPGDVFAAKGRTGRLNSGVLIAKNGPTSQDFFERFRRSATEGISDEDRAGLKYENGNLIYLARKMGGVTEIPLEWNNTHDVDLVDHIRHFTGPLKQEHHLSRVDSRIFAFRQRLSKPSGPAPTERDLDFVERLRRLSATTQHVYPGLVSQHHGR